MPRRTPRWVTGVVLLLVSGLLVACAGRTSPAAQDQVTLHLKWLHQAQFAGFYMAKQAEFYPNEGIDVTITPGGVDAPPIPAVLNGEAQFGVAGADDLIQARAQGAPVVALAVIFQKSPVCFITLAESGIERPHDFAGLRVGVKSGTGTDLSYRVMMANVGVDTSRIQESPVGADLTPFLSGEVDVYPGFIINEPNAVRRAGYDIHVILASDYGVNMYADTLFTTEETLAQRPELVQRFVRASLYGWQYAVEHADETVDTVMLYAPDSERSHQESMLDVAVHFIIPGGVRIGEMDAAVWQEMQATLLEYGVIDTPVDLERLYTDEFVEEVW